MMLLQLPFAARTWLSRNNAVERWGEASPPSRYERRLTEDGSPYLSPIGFAKFTRNRASTEWSSLRPTEMLVPPIHPRPGARPVRLAALAAVIAACLLAGVAPTAAAAAEGANVDHPNVVVIYTDDQAVEEMACYGGRVSTPHMDRLAREGVRFTRYYPSTPLCSPSRYTALTGQNASRSRGLQQEHSTTDHALILWNTSILPGDFTIARVLRARGYATGMVGKWHNGEVEAETIAPDADPENPAVAAAITRNYRRICDTIRESTGFEYVESIYGHNIGWIPTAQALQLHNQEWVTHGALTFLEQNAARPFYLYVAATLPHAPNPLAALRGDPRITPAGRLPAPLAVQPSRADVLRRAEQAGLVADDYRKGAWAGLAWLDDGVGAILRKLDDLGLTGKTLVILASDNAKNGKMTCNLGLAPCLVRWPAKIGAGLVCDGLTSNVDLGPTVLDACGVPPPAGTPIDGRSWLPLFAGAGAAWRDALYLEVTYTRGVVTRGWKYIATRFPGRIRREVTPANRREYNQEGARYSSGTKIRVRYNADKLFPGYYDDDQLYDLRADPKEQLNLAGDRNHAAVLRDMQSRLRGFSGGLPHPFAEFKQP